MHDRILQNPQRQFADLGCCDQTDRDWGRQILGSLELHSRVAAGYAAISNACIMPPTQEDSMPSFWMAETLKYLYLLFSEDDVIDLKHWVFNTEAHPFRIGMQHP